MKGPLAAACLISAFVTACAEGVETDSAGSYLPTSPTTATTATTATTSTSTSTTGDDPTGGDSDAATGPPNTTLPPDTGEPQTSGGGGAVCGDGVRDFGEECDGPDLDGKTCETFGYEAGTLACDLDCTFLPDACYRCGDDVQDMAEACDGPDFGGKTCQTEGFGGGVLKCGPDCKTIDTSSCTPLPSCGNGVKENGEQCDGGQLGGQTCQSAGFDEGALACTGSCTLDTSGCTILMCAGQGEPCIFDENNLQSNCCPPGVKGNVLGICDIIICL